MKRLLLALLITLLFALYSAAHLEHYEDGSGIIDYGNIQVIYCLPWEICNEE